MIGGITTVEGDSNATFPFYMLSDLWDNQSNGSASDHEQVARHAANQQRTSKARTAAVLSKFKRKIQKQGFPQDDDGSGVYPTCLQTDDSWSARIQQNYFTPLVNDAANRTRKAFGDSDRRKVFRERGRAVMSFLCQLPGMLKRMLRPSTADASQCSPESVIDCVVLDDTSTILRGSDGMPTVHSVMNTIQTIHTSFSNGSRESAQVPTPCICLPTQKAEDVFLGYAAGVLLSSQGVGTIMESPYLCGRCPTHEHSSFQARTPVAETSFAIRGVGHIVPSHQVCSAPSLLGEAPCSPLGRSVLGYIGEISSPF